MALRVEDTDSPDSFKVSGRGELHLSVLIESMRREGFELCVSRPEVILHFNDKGEKLEPYEDVTIDIPEAYMGVTMEHMGNRKAEMQDMGNEGGRLRLHFKIPSRGLIGFRNEFMTDTRGEGIIHSLFSHYGPHKGELTSRKNGVLISMEQCESVGFALMNLEERGVIFIQPGTKCYEGMIVGEHARENDLVVNVAKAKKLSQHALQRQRRGHPHHPAPGAHPGTGPGVHRARRAGGSHPQLHPHAQAGAGYQRAEEVGKAGGRLSTVLRMCP